MARSAYPRSPADVSQAHVDQAAKTGRPDNVAPLAPPVGEVHGSTEEEIALATRCVHRMAPEHVAEVLEVLGLATSPQSTTPDGTWLTTTEAANRLAISRDLVLHYAREGRLGGVRIEGVGWKFPPNITRPEDLRKR